MKKIPTKEKTAQVIRMQFSRQSGEDISSSIFGDMTPNLDRKMSSFKRKRLDTDPYDSMLEDFPKIIIQPEFKDYMQGSMLKSIQKAAKIKVTKPYVDNRIESVQNLKAFIGNNYKES